MTPEQRAARKAERDAAQREKLRAHAARLAAEAPPLTPEQRDRLAGLLRKDR